MEQLSDSNSESSSESNSECSRLEINLQGVIRVVIGIAAIVVGATHLNDCTLEPRIPIYLIVHGSARILTVIVPCIMCAYDDRCVCILHIFTLIWLITGSNWIYSIYPPNYTMGDEVLLYCHRTVYLFAFIITTLMWVIIAVIIFCCCCRCFTLVTCGVTDNTPVVMTC